jgi:hypothetical protein
MSIVITQTTTGKAVYSNFAVVREGVPIPTTLSAISSIEATFRLFASLVSKSLLVGAGAGVQRTELVISTDRLLTRCPATGCFTHL